MKSHLILSVLFLFFFQKVNAQSSGFPSGQSCATAPLVYPLDGYSSIPPHWFPTNTMADYPTTFCGFITSNQWISFIAGSTSLELEITVVDCIGSGQNGLQAHAYSICDDPWTSVSNCLYSIEPNSQGLMNFFNLAIGETYYIMFDVGDGFEAYQCYYSIAVLNGSTLPCSSSIIADAGEDVYLNCTDDSPIILDGGNSTFGVGDSIMWFKNDLISTDIQFTTQEAGTYYFVILNDSSNCMMVDEVQVIDFHEVIEAENEFNISATMDSIFYLDAVNIISSDTNLIFSWTTLDGNIISGADSIAPLISSGGVYELMVIDTVTGCILTETVNVNFTIISNIFSPTKNQIQVEVIPNITNDLLTVSLVLEKTSPLQLQLFNAEGIAVQDFNFGEKQNGEHQFELSIQDLPAGVYFILIKTEKGSAVKRVVKM